MDKYKEKILRLRNEFRNRFHVFNELSTNLSLAFYCERSIWQSPNGINRTAVRPLKDKFTTVTVDLFYQNLGPAFPRLSAFASKILSIFGTTYLCEQAFSVMNINKSNLHSRLTHRHLNDIMTVATTQKLVPDVDALVEEKRCQVSGSKSLCVFYDVMHYKCNSIFFAKWNTLISSVYLMFIFSEWIIFIDIS